MLSDADRSERSRVDPVVAPEGAVRFQRPKDWILIAVFTLPWLLAVLILVLLL